jgi:hypothetical protein
LPRWLEIPLCSFPFTIYLPSRTAAFDARKRFWLAREPLDVAGLTPIDSGRSRKVPGIAPSGRAGLGAIGATACQSDEPTSPIGRSLPLYFASFAAPLRGANR